MIMNKEFKPIAMRCSKEQFEAIKPKLEGKVSFNSVSICEFKKYNYLVNCDAKMITNISKEGFKHVWKNVEEIHETWNENVFLDACGIEVEEKFEISKEQICKLFNTYGNDKDELLQELFPKAFEPEKKELVVGKWYVREYLGSYYLICYKGNNMSYGFRNGEWSDDWHFSEGCNDSEATQQEVEEALKAQCVRLGVKLGVAVSRIFDCNLGIEIIDRESFPDDSEWFYNFEEDYMEHYGFVVYSRGQFAEVYKRDGIKLR